MHFQPYLLSEARPTTPPTPIVFEPADPTRWEYRVVTLDPREESPLDAERLNALGAEGWLLATSVTLPAGQVIERIVYYFVRPL